MYFMQVKYMHSAPGFHIIVVAVEGHGQVL
jgi:hypothetical protein